jgi:hypothetical protein
MPKAVPPAASISATVLSAVGGHILGLGLELLIRVQV